MHVQACDPEHPDARALLAELSAITGSSGAAWFVTADVRAPGAAFIVARGDDGRPLGCAALRPLSEGVGEIKRMYARPGTGAGTALLAHLESIALQFAYHSLWLETRRVNARAVAFYERHGYTPIDNYGRYAGRAEAVCLGRRLAPDSSASTLSA